MLCVKEDKNYRSFTAILNPAMNLDVGSRPFALPRVACDNRRLTQNGV